MTNIKKNLLIAALERALWDGKNAAGIADLSTIETTIADLRAAFTSDPASVSDEALSDIVLKVSKLTFPVENPWRLYLELNGQDGAPLSNPLKVYWQNILNRPALALESHTHDYAATNHAHADLAPLAHSHDYAATNHAHADLAPLAHSHDYAATNHAHADLAPLAHSHDYAATNHAHADLAPLAHSHVKASITDFTHTHPENAPVSHTHANYSETTHTHTQVAGLSVHSARNNEANKIVRTNGSGYLDVGYLNSNIGIDNPTIANLIADSGDGYFRKASIAHVAQNTGLARMAHGSYTGNGGGLTVYISPAITPTAALIWNSNTGVFYLRNVSYYSGITFAAGAITVSPPFNSNGVLHLYIVWGY